MENSKHLITTVVTFLLFSSPVYKGSNFFLILVKETYLSFIFMELDIPGYKELSYYGGFLKHFPNY